MPRKSNGRIDIHKFVHFGDARQQVVRICKAKAELDLLDRTEELVQRWERAQRLRDYAKALASSTANELTAEFDDRASRVAWILRAADWLDPLVNKPWPEVDDVPSSPV